MSLYIDLKYVSLLSPKLERFVKKSEYLWNFRCPLCGDSYKNKLKARGYIYRRKSDLFFSCHNCGASNSFGNFLRSLDNSLFREYQLERYKNENAGNTAKPDFSLAKSQPTFTTKAKINLPSIDQLAEDHSARLFVQKRKIPKVAWKELYYANDFQHFVMEVLPECDKKLMPEEPRVIIPFYDENKNLLGFQGRALSNSKVRYITIKLSDENRKVYGIDKLDRSKRVCVVEGPIDSLFLDNAVAVMDASLQNVIPVLGDLDYVFVFDNEPRNPEICNNMRKVIDMGKKIVIWPSQIKEKDINDMVLAGRSVQSLIDSNTFSELRARLEFEAWKK